MLSARAAIFVALAGVVPGVVLWASGAHLGTVPDTALFGLAIVSSAFLLAWAAEASETEIAQGLAVAFVALIAVLPEYAVSMSFAWKAGQDAAYTPFAVANMTGANRLLIGAAWPLISNGYAARSPTNNCRPCWTHRPQSSPCSTPSAFRPATSPA